MLSKTVFDGVGKMGYGCAGRGIAEEYPPKAEVRTTPRSLVVRGAVEGV
jgi:hypothetical protein